MAKLIVAAILCLAIAGQALAQERVFAQQGCIERVPRAPIDLMATPGIRTINIAWNAPNGDACVDTYDYVVYEKAMGRPRAFGANKVREYSITVKDLKPDTIYVIEVTAVNSMKGASPAATTTVRTQKACNKTLKPGTINPVFMNQASSSTLLLSWLPPAGTACVDGYKVEGFDVNTNKRVLAMSGTDPKAKAVSLTPGRQYKFQLTAINGNRDGPTTRVTYKMLPSFKVVASGSVPAGRKML